MNTGSSFAMAGITALALFISGMSLVNESDSASEASQVSSTVTTTSSTTTSTASTIPGTVAPVAVVVPPLGGLTTLQATTQLRDLGLVYTSSEVDATVGFAIDAVVSSNPVEGTPVLTGDTVDVVVGRRPVAVTVARPEPLPWDDVDWIDAVDRTVGRCSVGRQDGVGMYLDVVNCDEPHDFQYLAEILAGGEQRDDASLSDFILERCGQEFEAFVGAPERGSSISLSYLVPTLESWEDGYGTGECLISTPSWSEQLVGSAAGSLW